MNIAGGGVTLRPHYAVDHTAEYRTKSIYMCRHHTYLVSSHNRNIFTTRETKGTKIYMRTHILHTQNVR